MTLCLKLRFFVSSDLSRLARWLRLLGFDTVIAQGNNLSQWKRICSIQNRILLTRTRHNFSVKGFKQYMCISSEHHPEQLKQVVDELMLDKFCLFSRCLYCNRTVHPIAKEKVKHLLPEKVLIRENTFTGCRKCGKIYWKGTHFDSMLLMLKQILGFQSTADLQQFVLTDFR